jgi:hypothetical protein
MNGGDKKRKQRRMKLTRWRAQRAMPLTLDQAIQWIMDGLRTFFVAIDEVRVAMAEIFREMFLSLCADFNDEAVSPCVGYLIMREDDVLAVLA